MSLLSQSPQPIDATNPQLWSTTTTGSATITSTGGAILTSNTVTGTLSTSPYYNYDTWKKPYVALENLDYIADFDIDKNNMLKNNIRGIRKNKILFNCDYIGNRIQPYEFIMKLIEDKTKISVTVHVSDVLSICYTNLQFTKIENNINFDEKCDFSKLKVKFIYEDILYENHKLSVKELRVDKLKKIISKGE